MSALADRTGQVWVYGDDTLVVVGPPVSFMDINRREIGDRHPVVWLDVASGATYIEPGQRSLAYENPDLLWDEYLRRLF